MNHKDRREIGAGWRGGAWSTGVWGWLAVLVIVGYSIGIALFALRAPFGDDFGMIEGANAFSAAQTPAEAWAALSYQHNEHRPVVVRFAFWVAEIFPGPLDVTPITLVGNLSLLLMFGLLLREWRRVDGPAAFVLVAAVLMFNFGFSETSIMAMTAISNFGVLSAMVAMLVLLSLGGVWTWVALVAALVSVGMQGNGLLAPFIGAAYLLVNRRPVSGAVWLAAGAATAVWFLTGYVSSTQGAELAGLAGKAGGIVVYALAFCGAAIGFGSDSLGAINLVFVSISATLGAIMIGLSGYAVLRGGLSGGRIALWVNLFIVISAFATAVSRVDYGLQQALVPRYHINSCLMIATTLIAMLDLGKDDPVGGFIRKAMSTFGVLAGLYWLAVIPILWMVRQLFA